MRLGCSCVVKTHPRKAALWTPGGTTWQRMWSRFLRSCAQQARGSLVFLLLRRSEQGSRSPSNTDICWNPSPGVTSILSHLTPSGHLILCSQSPGSNHTHTQRYTHYCQEKVPGEAPLEESGLTERVLFPRIWGQALLIHLSRQSGFRISATKSLNRGPACVENLGVFPLEHSHAMCLRAKYDSRDNGSLGRGSTWVSRDENVTDLSTGVSATSWRCENGNQSSGRRSDFRERRVTSYSLQLLQQRGEREKACSPGRRASPLTCSLCTGVAFCPYCRQDHSRGRTLPLSSPSSLSYFPLWLSPQFHLIN